MIVTETKESVSTPLMRRQDKKEKGRDGNSPHTNVLVGELVREADPLRLVLDRLAVDDGRLELLDDAPVDSVTLTES